MAAVIDATVGGVDANSYVIVADADAYFDARLNITEWTAADTDNRTRALIMSTARIDRESFDGARTAPETQALKWPRTGTIDEEGRSVLSTIVPEDIKVATFELALALLQGDILKESGLAGFDEIKIGPIELVVRQIPSGILPDTVVRYLAPYRSTISRRQVRLIRG